MSAVYVQHRHITYMINVRYHPIIDCHNNIYTYIGARSKSIKADFLYEQHIY